MDSSSFYCFIVSKPIAGNDLDYPYYNKKGKGLCVYMMGNVVRPRKNEIDKL